jgi:hypothetical protein
MTTEYETTDYKTTDNNGDNKLTIVDSNYYINKNGMICLVASEKQIKNNIHNELSIYEDKKPSGSSFVERNTPPLD